MKSKVVHDEAQLERTLGIVFGDPGAYNVPKGIIRFDYGTTHAWRVSIARDKAKFVEYFFDGQSGSIENSLRRAILFRHEILAAFPVTISYNSKRAIDPNPLKRISRHSEPAHLIDYVYWRATWHNSEYRRKTKNYSVNKFGEAEARKLALETATQNHNQKPREYLLQDPHAEESWKELSREDVHIAATSNDLSKRDARFSDQALDSDPFGYEGEHRVKLHMSIERDRSLRNSKVDTFLQQNGQIYCELCKFRFTDVFPFLKKEIIEVHHITPLAQLTSSTLISLDDLMLLCPNCHTAIHQGDAVANLSIAKEQFRRRANDA